MSGTFTTAVVPGRVPGTWYLVLPMHHTWSNGTALTNKKFRWQQAEKRGSGLQVVAAAVKNVGSMIRGSRPCDQ